MRDLVTHATHLNDIHKFIKYTYSHCSFPVIGVGMKRARSQC